MIQAYLEKPQRLVIGLMSGTSVDGVDAALVRISGPNDAPRMELVAFTTLAYPCELRERVLRCQLHTITSETCQLNFVLGERFAEAALQVIRTAGMVPSDVDLIGSHGQTVCHLPSSFALSPGVGVRGSTLQIGEPSIIAQRTGILTIADFRVADVAAGGQGAPLVSMADFILLRHPGKHRIIQNIGGIANLTFLPAGCTLADVIAFDTGPGNMVIDALVAMLSDRKSACDEGGERAGRGQINREVLNDLLSHPFLLRKPPKSTGREEFGVFFTMPLVKRARALRQNEDDLIATVTAFTVESIVHAYRHHLPPLTEEVEVIVGGGGARNATIMKWLAEKIAPWKVLTHEDVGIHSDAKEAIAFALLAHLTACGLPGNVPTATGAKRAVVLGKMAFA